jgi:hypothetical protein
MLTGVAVMPTMPRYIPYAWVFVVVVILLIVLIFIRMYGRGDRSGGRRTAHSASHEPERGGDRGHRAVSDDGRTGRDQKCSRRTAAVHLPRRAALG